MTCDSGTQGSVNENKAEKILQQRKSYKMPLINDKTIKWILSYPSFFRGYARTATGKIYKAGEFEKRSNRV